MTSTIRYLCASGLLLGCVLAAPNAVAQGKSDKGNKVEKTVVKADRKINKAVQKTNDRVVARRVVRRSTYRPRVLCDDGVVVYRTTYTCAGHGGIAARQGNYGTTPRASARARERASLNSAVRRGPYSSTNSSGAIARCNDGTYWHATTRTGACYRHGGVAFWI
ncbi:MAG: DUF3761 domain-containing protein [Gemmatimonadales bacterium]